MTNKLNNFLLVFFVSVLIYSCGSTENEYELNAQMEGVSDGWIVLNKVVDNDLVPVDSVESQEGTFTFSGTIEQPEVFFLDFRENQKYHRVFIEPGIIEMTGDIEMPEITGSESHDVFNDFNKSMTGFDDRMRTLANDYRAAMGANNREKAQEIEQQFEALEDEKEAFMIRFVEDHNSSPAAPYIMVDNIYMFELDQMEQALAGFNKTIYDSKYARLLKQHASKLQNVAIGKMAPLFTQKDTAGNPVALEDLHGKYLLIDFWASWCKPCRAENPNLVKAHEKYSPKGFEILGVSLDRDKKSWIRAIGEDNLDWLHVSDLRYWNNEASDLYGVNSIPANFLLDPEGIIVAKNLRGDKLHEKLSELLD